MDSAEISSLRQGDVLAVGDEKKLVAIVSQTCDIVQEKRESIQVCPLVNLNENQVVERSARYRENPRYVLVGRENSQLFADLARIYSMSKSDLTDVTRSADSTLMFESSFVTREFGLAVGRFFSRFAVPDGIQPWLAPLQSLIREKYRKENSELGRVLREVVEIRVEASDWEAPKATLTIHVICKAGSVPSLPDSDMQSLSDLSKWDLNKVLSNLLKDDVDAPLRVSLWHAFAQCLADRCKPKSKTMEDPDVALAVAEVEAVLWSDDEFPLSKVRRSEQLDIDFLSDPTPF